MATNRKIYEIKLEDISQNGTLCKNPSVEFEKPYCAEVRCYTETTGGDYVLKIEIPEDCPDPCVYAIIDCQDDCGECEPQRIRICPCVEDADCPDCHECVNNLCVSECLDGETCVDGMCKECADSTDCPCNQVCVNGDCQCPPNAPFVDNRGCCANCDAENPCPPCYECTPDGCVPIICPVGVCNPETGECAECNGTGDCTGDNECCVDNKCECCFGFVRDPLTGDCVPDPGCLTDSDCPECEICTEMGCVPTSCPSGYVSIPGFPCCAVECDCALRDCPGRDNCVNLDDTTCYCASCVGSCQNNGDCGEGCYCVQGQCVPNPCYKPCSDGSECDSGCGCSNGTCIPCDSLNCFGTDCAQADGCKCVNNTCTGSPCAGPCQNSGDCGPGCGCFQGQCVDCASLGCDECDFAAGCDCVNNVCGASPCKGACAGPDDCPGVDCGCYGGECVQCSAYTCENQPCPFGCACDENNQCYGNPCINTTCSSNADCGINCSCEGGFCQPCPEDNPNCGAESCGDLIVLGRDDENCTLEATLTQDTCCGCRDIVATVQFLPIVSPTNWPAVFTLRVGDVNSVSNPYTLPAVNTVLDPSGNPILVDTSTVVTIKRYVHSVGNNPVVTSFTGTLNPTPLGNGYSVTISEIKPVYYPGQNNVTRIEYYLHSLSNGAKFADECDYALPTPKLLWRYEASQGAANFELARVSAILPGAQLQKVNQCRSPLFRFYKSAAQNGLAAATPFAYAYGVSIPVTNPQDQRAWKATIDATDDLEYGQYYKVDTDCGCEDPGYYNCAGVGLSTPTPLVFCHLEESDLNFSVDAATNCTQMDFLSDPVIDCPVMATTDPAKLKPRYRVVINGQPVGTWISPVTVGPDRVIPLVALGTINFGQKINTVGLEIERDTCSVCDVEKPAVCDSFDAEITLVKGACDTSGTYGVKIVTNQGPLVQIAYDVEDSTSPPPVATGTFYNTQKTITGITDPAAAEPITITATRVSDGATVTTTLLYDPNGYGASSKLSIEYECGVGTGGYVGGTNQFTTGSATLQVFDSNTMLSIGSVQIAANGYGVIFINSGVSYYATLTYNPDPTCFITETDIVLNCCGTINVSDFDVEITCTGPSSATIAFTNNSAQAVVMRVADLATNNSEIFGNLVAPGATQTYLFNNKTSDYAVLVRSAAYNDCPEQPVRFFDLDDCCTEILDKVAIGLDCRSGNGPGAVGTLVVTNGTSGPLSMSVYLISGSSTTLLYTGTNPVFEYTPPSAPSNATIKVVIGTCEKTQSINFNCEQ